MQELWFIRSADHLMLIGIDMKFYWYERFSSYRADTSVRDRCPGEKQYVSQPQSGET